MAAIFQFFHNGQCQYYISVDPEKIKEPNFVVGGEGGNLTFFYIMHIYEMSAIFFKKNMTMTMHNHGPFDRCLQILIVKSRMHSAPHFKRTINISSTSPYYFKISKNM